MMNPEPTEIPLETRHLLPYTERLTGKPEVIPLRRESAPVHLI